MISNKPAVDKLAGQSCAVEAAMTREHLKESENVMWLLR